jgi:hypothetical protein
MVSESHGSLSDGADRLGRHTAGEHRAWWGMQNFQRSTCSAPSERAQLQNVARYSSMEHPGRLDRGPKAVNEGTRADMFCSHQSANLGRTYLMNVASDGMVVALGSERRGRLTLDYRLAMERPY